MKLLDRSFQSLTDADLPQVWEDFRNSDTAIAIDLSYNEATINEVRIPADLGKLEYLYLYKSNIKSVVLEGSLPKLSILHIGENQLETFRLPAGFPELEHLRLDKNQLKTLEFEDPSQLKSMRSLFLKENQIENIDSTIWDGDENCWERVKTTLQASQAEAGVIVNQEAKVIWFGNGEAGKTTLSHQLRHKKFKDFDRTHGILINDWQIPFEELPETLQAKFNKAVEDEKAKRPNSSIALPKNITLKMWDFGGQEYYHATHRLFLNNNVLYLLVWNDKLEKQDEKEGIYPRKYWEKSIRNYADEDNPILEVQNKVTGYCNPNPSEGRFKVILRKKEDELSVGLYNREVQEFEQGIINHLHRLPHLGQPFPKAYEDIRQALRSIKNPFVTFSEYKAFCQENDPTKGKEDLMQDPKQLENFTKLLHDIGNLISYKYHETYAESLKKYVFLQPNWVTDGIYKILEKNLKEKEEYAGEFDLAHVKEKIADMGLEAEEWVDLMKQFELIFEKQGQPQNYVAPQYLPQRCPDLSKRALNDLKEELPIKFTLYYPSFLSKSVITRFISRYGNFAKDYYWKYGIVIRKDTNSKAVVIADYRPENRKSVEVECNDRKLAIELFQTLYELSEKKGTIELYSPEKKVHKTLKEIFEYPEAYKKEFWFAFDGVQEEVEPKVIPQKTPVVYFSYAWGDEQEKGESREKLVDDLYHSLNKDGYQLKRDKMDLGYKGFISDFMKEIGRGDTIVVAISDKYVRSPYCMFELLEIARNCKFEKGEFAKRILPVGVEQIDFTDPDVLDTYLDYWDKEEKKWESLFQKRMGKLSPAQFTRYQRVKDIHSKISEIMDWWAEMNRLTKDLLSENDFAIIKAEIGKKVLSTNDEAQKIATLVIDALEGKFDLMQNDINNSLTKLGSTFEASAYRVEQVLDKIKFDDREGLQELSNKLLVIAEENHNDSNELTQVLPLLKELKAQNDKSEKVLSAKLKVGLPILDLLGIAKLDAEVEANLGEAAKQIWSKVKRIWQKNQ